jgi:hypothetical protein
MAAEERARGLLLERTALAGCALVSGALLAWLLALAPHGLDFSDEGYYLAWLDDPFRYDASASQFGFVYHPLHLLLGGNVAWLRQANIVLSFALATWMFLLLARAAGVGTAPGHERIARLIVAAGLGCASLVVFSQWLITPNYNTLVLQAFAIAVAGFACCTRTVGRPFAGALLLGLGGAVAFLAKPSSAALLAPLMGLALLANGRTAWRSAAVAAACAAGSLLVFAAAVDGDPFAFAQRLRDGAQVMHLLGSKYSLADAVRWEWWALTSSEQRAIGAALLTAGGAAWLGARVARWANMLAMAVTLLLLVATVVVLVRREPVLPFTLFVNMVMAGAALGAAAAALLSREPRKLGGDDARRWLQALCIAALPAAHAFGSNNAYWHVGGFTVVFWIAGAVFALAGSAGGGHVATRALLPIAACVQLLASALLMIGHAQPYRQSAAAGQQRTPLVIRGGTLFVTPEVAAHFEVLQREAAEAGFEAGTPVIDFTGQSPTALYVLGARPLGLAWWAGGYPGSNALAAWVLQRLPCDQFAVAWLFVEPGGPRALDTALLQSSGANMSRDYATAFTALTPSGAGEFPQRRAQAMLRPQRDAGSATRACEAARASR